MWNIKLSDFFVRNFIFDICKTLRIRHVKSGGIKLLFLILNFNTITLW
jgi:hypothetical protein